MLSELGDFGTRARPFNTGLREKVLIIGLGQVGLAAAADVYTMLGQSLPPRERAEHTRVLAIAQQHSIWQEKLLPREHRVLLQQEALEWRDIPGRYATLGVAKWWPQTPNHAALQADPTSARAFGRLLLWTNSEIVGNALFEAGEWLMSASQRANQPRTILVLASLAEAEGSAMLFDVVGRLRALVVPQDTTVVGVFTADSDFADKNAQLLAMAHVYASLKELDAISLQPKNYPHEWPVIGRQLPNPPRQRELFEQICITGDTSYPIPQTQGVIAEFALTYILSLVGAQERPPLLPRHERNTDGQNRYRAYSCFGLARLTLPVRATLEHHVIGIAKGALRAMLFKYDSRPDEWIHKVMIRARNDLYHNGGLASDHHLLVDSVRDLRRRLRTEQLKGRVVGGARSREGWVELLKDEWARLMAENELPETGFEAGPKAKGLLRRRVDDALDENCRKLAHDIEQLAVTLAFAEGYGLVWVGQLFRALLGAIEKAGAEAQKNSQQARRELYGLRDNWFAAGESRNMGDLDEIGHKLIGALVEWIAWEGRAAYWGELQAECKQLCERLDLAVQQIPNEIKRLEGLESALAEALGIAIHNPPTYPTGVLCSESWISSGTRNLPTPGSIPPHELLMNVFKRWNPSDYDPSFQLQKFPMDVLHATRLTLQPHSSFINIHDFILQHGEQPQLKQALVSINEAAQPNWKISTVTGRLDDKFLPPTYINIVREAPNPFSAVPNSTSKHVTRYGVPSPDPDEVLNIYLTHGWTAEHVHRLRDDYRRAYYRVISDNVPLHIDRRWEMTMADLIHTSLRTEISNHWDATVQANNPRHPEQALYHLKNLSNTLVNALDAEASKVQHLPTTAPDIQLLIYPLRPFRLRIPPPNCAVVFLLAQRGTSEVVDDLLRTLSAYILEENFLFVVNLAGRPDIGRLLEPLRQQSYIPLELTESDIKHVASAPRPSHALRSIVISRINLSAVSPFYTRAPVPDHMFFGREREIADVRSKLTTHSVVLIGGRRIGKTSTLQKIYRTLYHSDNNMMPYYMDCSNLMAHDHFFRRMQREWGVPRIHDSIEFDEVVQELASRQGGKQPVFLLDEVDRLLKTDQGEGYAEPLFRTFRSLSNEKLCQFVFSGEKLLLSSMSNAHSVMFNFPKKVKLNPLRPDVVRRLVSEPFEMLNLWLEDPDGLVGRIYEISAGHPNIVQTICHALVEVIDQDKQANLLKRTHLGKALDMHQVQVDIVDTIWGQMHPLAKLVTLIWPENVVDMNLEEMLKLLRGVGLKNLLTQQVKEDVIPDLELYNFILQEGQRYRLIPAHFPTILDFMTDKKMEIRSIIETQLYGEVS